jgi:hypothetical protein
MRVVLIPIEKRKESVWSAVTAVTAFTASAPAEHGSESGDCVTALQTNPEP